MDLQQSETLLVRSQGSPALDERVAGSRRGMQCGAERGARATVTVVSTATAAARSRRREKCSVTDAIATLEGARERACATPATYASRFAVLNSERVMASVPVKVTTDLQSEHASQGGAPPAPSKPAEQ